MNLLGHLSCFVAVAEELHFGRAADRLGMAQPPLSQRIQRLESELGGRLFDRSSRHVELTALGRALLDDAREILARADRIYALAERSRLGSVGTLRTGLPPDLGGAVLASLIGGFRETCPDLRLEPQEISTAEQVRALTEGTLDVGVLRHPFDVRGFETGPTLGQPVGVLLPATAPQAATASMHLSDLTGHDLVLFPREDAPGTHDEVLTLCRQYGFGPAAVHEVRHPQFALGLVLSGSAVALTPRVDETAGAVWRPLAGEPIVWRTSCAWLRDRRDEAIERFVAVATDVLRRHAGMAPLDPRGVRRVVPRPASGFLA